MTTPIERPNGTDSGKNLLAQILLLLTGMAVHTLGIALITRADLGTTPISTLPLTLSAVMGVTLGTSTFIINIAFFLSQIVMLGSRFERRQWLQLPSVLLFSAMIDAWMAVLSRVPVEGAVRAGAPRSWRTSSSRRAFFCSFARASSSSRSTAPCLPPRS